MHDTSSATCTYMLRFCIHLWGANDEVMWLITWLPHLHHQRVARNVLNQLLWLSCEVKCTVRLSEGLVCVEGERDRRLNHYWVGAAEERVAVPVVCVCMRECVQVWVCVCVSECVCVVCICACVCICLLLYMMYYAFITLLLTLYLRTKLRRDRRLIILKNI